MTLDELKAKLKDSIKTAQADEQRYRQLLRQEGAARLGGSANATSMHLAREKAETLTKVLRDVETINKE